MATVVTSYDAEVAPATRHGLLRRMIAGAALFDGAMGVFTLAAAGAVGDWLSIGSSPVRITGGVFLVAALAGAATLRRHDFDARGIVAANAVFAAWCLVVLGVDGPNAVGVALLIASAVASGGTAISEWVLSRR